MRRLRWRESPATASGSRDRSRRRSSFGDVPRDEAAAIVAAALGRGDEWLAPDEIWRLLACYGLPVLDQRVVSTAEDAARAAEELGGVVALKAVAPGLVHKTEAGAVRLNLRPSEVLATARQMAELLQGAGMIPAASRFSGWRLPVWK